MERLLSNLIPVKHVLYIIQEYMREKYVFLNELLNKTSLLKYDSDHYFTYEDYCICIEPINNYIIRGTKINHSYCYSNKSDNSWKSMTKDFRSRWFR